MLARTSILNHKASGVSIETPLLIPSFSSRGFAQSASGQSEVGRILAIATEFLSQTFLISAYDIAYGHVPKPQDLPVLPELLVVDSGGYELSETQDLSAVTHGGARGREWSLERLAKVLDAWPDEVAAIFVSFDHPEVRQPFGEQVAAARRLFKGRSQHLHTLLIKPEKREHETVKSALSAAAANIDELKSFDVIGVVEKDLGTSMLDRMVRVARLRRAMNEAGVDRPIHLFGALDPVAICLYFISGAEMFDGLTWLRYAYDQDRCVYPQNVGALKYGLHSSNDLIRTRMMAENYYYLLELSHRLKDFEATKDWTKLPHSDFLRNATDSLNRRLAKGGA